MPLTIEQLQGKIKSLNSGVNQYDFSRYRWQGKEIITPHKSNVSSLAKSIVEMNKRISYLSIAMAGQSGSGKSSATTTLIHRISCVSDSPYIVKWFSGKDLYNMKEILEKLPKSQKYILVFDDVSYIISMQKSAAKKFEIANALTYVRHTLGENSKVITIMNFHYARALPPAYRSATVRVLTSMSDEDRGNWEKVFSSKDAKYKLKRFQTQYASQLQKGYFYLNNNTADKQNNYFKTDQPYRVTLVSEISGLRNVLMPKESCKMCRENKNEIAKEKISAQEFFDDITKAYTVRAKAALGYWSFFRKGNAKILPAQSIRALRYITKMLEKYDVNFEELEEIVTKHTNGTRKKVHPKYSQKSAAQRESELVGKNMDLTPNMALFD